MKDYIFATVIKDDQVYRKRVCRSYEILYRYYSDMFDFCEYTDKGFPARASLNTFLKWEYIDYIEASDC